MSMPLSNKEVINKVNDAFARGDVEEFLNHCSDDFLWTMVGSPSVRGKAAVRAFWAAGPSEPPTFTVDTVVAEGDMVTAIGDMTMEENGKVTPYSYCDVWRFRDGKIAELRAFVIRTEAVAAV
jgi:ketosteroid isomerase-like protein